MNATQTVNLKVGVKSAPPIPPADTVSAGSESLVATRSGRQSLPLNPQATWTGKVLGEYEIGELIGVGGNGQVYRARHRCLDVPVALKFLRSVDRDDEATVNRFRQEAMASARLVHPNLVRATDAGILERHLFLVTDLVEGVNLHELFHKEEFLNCENVCELGRMACEGLHFLATNNTVHRDIKPSNIMVDKNGQVRILDLGLARSGDQANTLTMDGQIMGTVDFMSPEQAMNPRHVDFHADMYSMGCTLYFLLAGKAPFEDQHQTITAKLMAHMGVPAAPISHFRKDIPEDVEHVVMAMLEKDVANRPESFHEVIDVLSTYAVGHNLAELVGGEGHSVVRHAAVARTDVRSAAPGLGPTLKPKSADPLSDSSSLGGTEIEAAPESSTQVVEPPDAKSTDPHKDASARRQSLPDDSSTGFVSPEQAPVPEKIPDSCEDGKRKCPACGVRASWGEASWCPNCAYYPELAAIVRSNPELQTVADDDSEEDQLTAEDNCRWMKITLGGVGVILLQSLAVGVWFHYNDGPRGQWCIVQTLVGLACFVVGQTMATLHAMLKSGDIRLEDVVVRPFIV